MINDILHNNEYDDYIFTSSLLNELVDSSSFIESLKIIDLQNIYIDSLEKLEPIKNIINDNKKKYLKYLNFIF